MIPSSPCGVNKRASSVNGSPCTPWKCVCSRKCSHLLVLWTTHLVIYSHDYSMLKISLCLVTLLKGYSSQWDCHSIYLHLYNILVVHSNCAQRSLINNWLYNNCRFRALPSWDLCASDVNRLGHWRMHVRTFYICPMVFDVSSMSRIVYVTIISEDSANPCLFHHCASDINDLAYVIGA